MKLVMCSPLMTAACEPNLAKLPVTQTVRVDERLRSGGLWVTGMLLVAAPIFVALVLTAGVFAGSLSDAAIWDSALIWGTVALMFVCLAFGIREFYALWQTSSWSRTIKFGTKAVEVSENAGSSASHWREDYSDYVGIVLHVTAGEMPSHYQQMITLRHNTADRSILLHKSQGNGLDPVIQNRARLWVTQLDVPMFAESEAGNLKPVDLSH